MQVGERRSDWYLATVPHRERIKVSSKHQDHVIGIPRKRENIHFGCKVRDLHAEISNRKVRTPVTLNFGNHYNHYTYVTGQSRIHNQFGWALELCI